MDSRGEAETADEGARAKSADFPFAFKKWALRACVFIGGFESAAPSGAELMNRLPSFSPQYLEGNLT